MPQFHRVAQVVPNVFWPVVGGYTCGDAPNAAMLAAATVPPVNMPPSIFMPPGIRSPRASSQASHGSITTKPGKWSTEKSSPLRAGIRKTSLFPVPPAKSHQTGSHACIDKSGTRVGGQGGVNGDRLRQENSTRYLAVGFRRQ